MYKRHILLTITIIWVAFLFFLFLSFSGAKPVGEITKSINPLGPNASNFLVIIAGLVVFFVVAELFNYARKNRIQRR